MSKVRVLESKKQSLFSIVQNLYDSTKSLKTAEQKEKFLMRVLTLDQIREEFTQVVEEINIAELSANLKYEPSFKAVEAFDEIYCYVKSTQRKLTSDAAKTQTDIPINKPKHKLPVLELVPFNGDHAQWPLFYQNFLEMIHNNKYLTDAERVQYLVSKLSGPALSITAGILPVASNYQILWTLLVERYQDQRVLATQYLDKNA